MIAVAGFALCALIAAMVILGSLWCDLRRAAKANRNRWLERFLLLVAGLCAGIAFVLAHLIGEMT